MITIITISYITVLYCSDDVQNRKKNYLKKYSISNKIILNKSII